MNRVSNQQLLSRLESLANQERSTTLSILLHLNEVDRRRLHLSLGYGSMFDFATRQLLYSASAAVRRIQVARCIRRYPELIEPFRRGEVNLSTIAMISGVLDEENGKELIRAIRGKSQREVEATVARYRPAVEIRDRVRPVRARANRKVTDPDPSNVSPLFELGPQGAGKSRSGSEASEGSGGHSCSGNETTEGGSAGYARNGSP